MRALSSRPPQSCFWRGRRRRRAGAAAHRARHQGVRDAELVLLGRARVIGRRFDARHAGRQRKRRVVARLRRGRRRMAAASRSKPACTSQRASRPCSCKNVLSLRRLGWQHAVGDHEITPSSRKFLLTSPLCSPKWVPLAETLAHRRPRPCPSKPWAFSERGGKHEIGTHGGRCS